MSHKSDLIATDIQAYLAEHEQKDLLRFLTCGSVDDGKSTLIGRLLHDAHMIYEDQLASVEADSTTQGSTGGGLDLALLMDGLKAEREQGITIDVAYRYFSTARRKFIIADTPGHEQYTRNMATGASTCDLAILLIDARHGVATQTRRHSFIVSLLGIKHVVVAVNKMDLVDWSKDRFEEIRDDYVAFATSLGIESGLASPLDDPYVLPVSALTGDNVVDPSVHMGWFDGPPLLEHLETVDAEAARNLDDLRFPVQLVSRPDLTFRGFQGTVASGVVSVDDEVMVLPSGTRSTVSRIVTFDGDLQEAFAGQAVTLVLADEVDVSRGDMIVHPDNRPSRSHDIDANLVWFSDDPLVPGKTYLVRQATRTTPGVVSDLHHRVDVNTLATEPASTLELNEIGRVTLAAEELLLFDPYPTNRTTGAFILIDRMTNATVAAGMVLDRAKAGVWDQPAAETLVRTRSDVALDERQRRYGQQAATVLLTGLPAAGKSTLAKALERRLFDRGRTTLRLDGQNMRLGLSRDLGFDPMGRSENLRRAAEVARLANNQGIIVLAAFVAPAADVRDRMKELILPERWIEVLVDAPDDVRRERDRAGSEMYARADRGEVASFPGVTAPYDRPVNADLVVDTSTQTVEESVDAIMDLLEARGLLRAPTA
jgi:bifunctional enzyme CysN/CysC